MADLYRTSGDWASMITLGPRGRGLPSTPAAVIAAFQGRGLVTIIPEIFRSGGRGQSSHVLATDGSELQAWIPAFGPAPFARSPEHLAHQLLEYGVAAVIASGPPPADFAQRYGPYDGSPVQPYASPEPEPAPPTPAPARRAKLQADWAQMELFA